jgi:hypothetical protein
MFDYAPMPGSRQLRASDARQGGGSAGCARRGGTGTSPPADHISIFLALIALATLKVR